MAKFSATDAAMTGFGVVRRTPSVLLWWTLFHILLTGGFSILMVIMAGPAMTQMMALQGTSITPDPQTQAQRFELLSQLAPLYLLMFPLSIAFYSVLYTAMNRAVLRPAQGALGYLRLGVEELRQFGLFLLTFVVFIGAYIGAIIFAVLLGFGLSMLGGLAGTDPSTAQIVRVIEAAVPIIATICGWIYVTTRLSLASPLTFDSKRVNLFGFLADHAGTVLAHVRNLRPDRFSGPRGRPAGDGGAVRLRGHRLRGRERVRLHVPAGHEFAQHLSDAGSDRLSGVGGCALRPGLAGVADAARRHLQGVDRA